MAKIGEIEIHSTFKGDIIIQRPDGSVAVYDEKSDKDFTDELYDIIASRYPDAMKTLYDLYKRSKANFPHFKYKIVSRFLRCNLGGYDNKMDFESNGKINLELVPCPLRGECEHEKVICRPMPRHTLSVREYEVMSLIYKGLTIKDIAHALCIAESTCKTHKRNAMDKTGNHTEADFIRYADDIGLFNR